MWNLFSFLGFVYRGDTFLKWAKLDAAAPEVQNERQLSEVESKEEEEDDSEKKKKRKIGFRDKRVSFALLLSSRSCQVTF